jgi:transposase InsO family protein
MSVLSTSVTKQTRDMRYSEADPRWFLSSGRTHDDAVCPGSRIVDQRLQFLSSYQKEEMSVSDPCREFGVSRPTGYRWINRYEEVGPEGLLDLSSRPHSCSHATPEKIENAILVLRSKHPSWGVRKLKARLEQLEPTVEWPAASTFGNILQRAGLTSPKRKKRRTTPYSEPFSEVTAPNQLWCMDFKGYFSTGDGSRCDPFTITDAHSRYLIRCQIVSRMDLSQMRAICEAAMREYGMPARIRTDNGAPFAGTGLLGLSKLSLGWMKMGIVHERIQPGRPQQNGRHERMHRTLKEDTTNPAAATLRLQQRKFDRFRQMFNHERPHQGLNNATPNLVQSTRCCTSIPEIYVLRDWGTSRYPAQRATPQVGATNEYTGSRHIGRSTSLIFQSDLPIQIIDDFMFA